MKVIPSVWPEKKKDESINFVFEIGVKKSLIAKMCVKSQRDQIGCDQQI